MPSAGLRQSGDGSSCDVLRVRDVESRRVNFWNADHPVIQPDVRQLAITAQGENLPGAA
jgi:hypothetical protein